MSSSNVQHRKNITYEEIRSLFEYSLKEAALKLNISTTQLKRLCREHGITRWPYRKVNNHKIIFNITRGIDLCTP